MTDKVAASDSCFAKGDVVWVQSGDKNEETAVVLDPDYTYVPPDVNEGDSDSSEIERGLLIQFSVSNIKGVYSPEKVRKLIQDDNDNNTAATASKRPRRSTRTSAPVKQPQTTTPSRDTKLAACAASPYFAKNGSSDNETSERATKEKDAAANDTDKNEVMAVDKTSTRPNRKRSMVTPSPKPSPAPEGDSKVTQEAPTSDETNAPETARTPKRSRKNTQQSGEKEQKETDKVEESDPNLKGSPYFDSKKPPAKAVSKKTTRSKKVPLIHAPPQDLLESEAEEAAPAEDPEEAPADPPRNNDNQDSEDEDRPYSVQYSPTGRATCRRCDSLIVKGEVRISHRPLFRGQRGFTVYRHLKCALFENIVHQAQDVTGWNRLKREDLQALKQRIQESKKELEQEAQELQPDELVQTVFSGEMRPAPSGLTATLLPFQEEGFSWMRNQEVNDEAAECGACRGGMLADEMGMGKTLQTIATILDNRPLLQLCGPGVKHPPDSPDFDARRREESLWAKALTDWNHEIKMNEIPKSMMPKKKLAGARAGTLVVCPVIALLQWKSEIEKFTEPGTVSVGIYHGPNRNSEMHPDKMRKYDIVLTTYQCLEQDFRKMVSPNKVVCPNCGGKYKIDKLKVHLKYFCGDGAQRTEAQARQRRSSNHRAGPGGGRGGGGGGGGKKGKAPLKKAGGKAAQSPPPTNTKKKTIRLKSVAGYDSDSDLSIDQDAVITSSRRPSRSAAKAASTKVTASLSDWGAAGKRENGDDSSFGSGPSSEDESSPSASDVSSGSEDDASYTKKKNTKPTKKRTTANVSKEDSSDSEDDEPIAAVYRKKYQSSPKKRTGKKSSKKDDSDEEDEEDSDVARAVEKQRKAMQKVKKGAAKKGKAKPTKGKPAKKKGKNNKGNGKGKKKFDPSSSDDSDDSSGGSDEEDPLAGIDLEGLAEEAMSGACFSILHTFCWHRIVLDEAHMIKTRSSQTAAAAFALTSIHRWCLSGTPLQNRVGELYSLIRFLRIDPMAHYFCRSKGCDCKSLHYRMKEGVCKDCGHRAFTHYSHFNRHILNVIQREGYSGDGRRAMFKLKNEVLDKTMIRRTKETRAEDMNLPPRIVTIRTLRLHPREEDFYNALYTQTRSSFDDYVAEGTLLNNYAHIFDLLTKMRQAVDHPYLIVYSKNNKIRGLAPPGPAVANGSVDCDICHESPMDRILSSCCNAGFCRACVVEYIGGAVGENTPCPSCQAPFSINLNQKSVEDKVDDDNLVVNAPIDSSTVPTLKTLSHVQSGSILRRINLAEFATSSKIEVLIQDLIEMRQERPGSKALVFSQFVNMLDLIRWRLHSDPCLAHMGLGVVILHGGMDIKSRDESLRQFREDPNIRILLMSLKAGGVALNLTVASEVFLVDNWWNPAAEMQAIDRTHRLGQHRPIRATRYICEGTVEERVLQLQEKKRLVFDGTIGRDAGSLKSLSVNDMKALFT